MPVDEEATHPPEECLEPMWTFSIGRMGTGREVMMGAVEDDHCIVFLVPRGDRWAKSESYIPIQAILWMAARLREHGITGYIGDPSAAG